ncbi:MAG: hypothetical protein QME60_06480 [Verrucomicrobiota bacterium]|nr:hypothetical protein [Verrucomicrobiota bacterium]
MATRLTPKDRARFLRRALKAANWYVNTQLGDYRPNWNADRGRFLYYYFMPDGRHVPGINWTQGRALFVLSEAYRLTGKLKYRAAAELGAAYIAALQVMDPRFKKTAGAIKETTPQVNWGGVLDGAQAASGLLMLEKVTRDPRHLRRGQAFCDYLLRNFSPRKGLPWLASFEPAEKIEYNPKGYCMAQCAAIPLWHLYCRTGERRYLPPLLWAADFILACQRDDGAIYYLKDPHAFPKPRMNHHEGRGKGDDIHVLRNDDAIMVVALAAYQETRKRKYLDAAVRYADWIVNNGPLDRPLCAFPVQANNVLDIGRVAGKDYSAWVLDNLKDHLLDLQVLKSSDPKAHGGFRGEDEENEGGIFGGTSFDYVTNRMTCYSAGALFRLSGKGTGAGFSVFGLR